MSESQPAVVHPEEAIAGPTAPGMELRQHFDPNGHWIGRSRWVRTGAGEGVGHEAAEHDNLHRANGADR